MQSARTVSPTRGVFFCSVLSLSLGCGLLNADPIAKPLNFREARILVTGYDHNRPDPFPGLGDFIGWAKGIERMPNGDLLLAHSAGYWHASFASPRLFHPKTHARYVASGWPVEFEAPTGGRSMASRSTDGGKTWSKPEVVIDLPLDDGPSTLFTCRDGTILYFVNVQASWYGFDKAPKQFEKDIGGLNTKQCLLRSTDNGKTWSEPIWIDGPGSHYERNHGHPIQLADGGILWPTYCAGNKSGARDPLFGAIHRSDDSGKTWRVISEIHRKDPKNNLDEPALAQLKDGRLILVTRLDGGVLYSEDKGRTWTEPGYRVTTLPGKFKAPQMFVLKDGTVVVLATVGTLRAWISTDNGKTWSADFHLDPTSYGYPAALLNEDESIIIAYCESGRAPSRIYVMKIRVNDKRDSIDIVSMK